MPGNSTIFLDSDTWDVALDSSGNIAIAGEPYSLAQDAASAIQTYAGECYWNTLLGVPYLTQVFGKKPSIATLKTLFANAALTVPGVARATCFIQAASGRRLIGQIQVTAKGTGIVTAATFETINPQGAG